MKHLQCAITYRVCHSISTTPATKTEYSIGRDDSENDDDAAENENEKQKTTAATLEVGTVYFGFNAIIIV